MLYKLLQGGGGPDGGTTIDLGSTYSIGYVSGCFQHYEGTSCEACSLYYSLDGLNFTYLGSKIWQASKVLEVVRARFIRYVCGIPPRPRGTVYAIYEALITTSLSISVDKLVVVPNASFIVSGIVKDQYNNPMNGQVVNINVFKSGILWSTASATADIDGNFRKAISTTGWAPDTYKMEVVSDDITQSVDVTVTYMSSVKFDTTCLDTGLACPAYVYVDGILKGISPVTIDNLPTGNHGYKVSKEGYNDATGTVNVQQGVIAELSISLTLVAKGSIFFNSVPVGAEIYLDGTVQGDKTPSTIIDVPTGTHNYIIKLGGFKDYEGAVLVEANITTTVDATLTPIEGCVYFVTSVPGAKIYVDNVNTGKVTPALVCGLSLATHTYRFEMPGYNAVTGSVSIGTGQGVVTIGALVPVEKKGSGAILGIVLLGASAFAVFIVTRGKKESTRIPPASLPPKQGGK